VESQDENVKLLNLKLEEEEEEEEEVKFT